MRWLMFLALIHLKDCKALVCTCDYGPNDIDCIEKCQVKEDRFENNKPYLLCHDENKLVVFWQEIQKNLTKYVIEYQPQGGEEWKRETTIKKVADKNMIAIENITGGYMFRIRPDSEEETHINVMRETEIFSPLPRNTTSISQIKNAWITDFKQLGRNITTTLVWKPVLELVCDYHIVVFNLKLGIIEEITSRAEELYHVKLNLFYSTAYEIVLFARTENHDGVHYQMSFETPSCNEMNNYNYNICDPEKPVDLKGTIKDCNATINWKTPRVFPDLYLMKIVMLTNGAELKYTIYGKEKSINIDTNTLSTSFEIHLQAVAKNYKSPPAKMRLKNQCKLVNNKKTEDNKNEVVKDTVSDKWTIIIVMIFLSFIVLASFVLISCQVCSIHQIRLERHIQSTTKMEDKSDGVKNTKETKEKHIGYDITSNMIAMKEVIGKGEFGIVFKALMKKEKEETEVAVKTLRDNATKEDIESFQEEVEVMRTVGKHDNLVSLIGYCPNEKLLVVEYCALGDLQNFLREARKTKLLIQELVNNSFAETNRFQMSDSNIVSNMIYERTEVEQKHLKLNIVDLLFLARQVATGMDYLTNNKIIHRDLATRNILLTFDLVAKISDFGLSRDIYEESVYRKKRVSKLPIKWMAIESLSHHIFTSQSDVWSFGILLWEVMTLGGAPYPSIPSAEVYKLLKTGYRMEKPPSCNAQVYEIMSLCWKEKPYNRPCFSQIIKKLDNILKNESVQNYSSFDTKSLNYAHIGSIEE